MGSQKHLGDKWVLIKQLHTRYIEIQSSLINLINECGIDMSRTDRRSARNGKRRLSKGSSDRRVEDEARGVALLRSDLGWLSRRQLQLSGLMSDLCCSCEQESLQVFAGSASNTQDD